MTSPKKIKKLKNIAKSEKPVHLLLDAKKEGDRITGVLFMGLLAYREDSSLLTPKGEGYYLIPSFPDHALNNIRLFVKELKISGPLENTLLISTNNSRTRGTLLRRKVIGREHQYGLTGEYVAPRESFPRSVVDVLPR